jgi:hypothetical protein
MLAGASIVLADPALVEATLHRPLAELIAATLDATARSDDTRRAYQTAIGLFVQYLDQTRGDQLPAAVPAAPKNHGSGTPRSETTPLLGANATSNTIAVALNAAVATAKGAALLVSDARVARDLIRLRRSSYNCEQVSESSHWRELPTERGCACVAVSASKAGYQKLQYRIVLHWCNTCPCNNS